MRSQLVPRFLAGWGLAGYAVLLRGWVQEILRFQLSSMHAIPGALWEVFSGVWLTAKGFQTSPRSSGSSTTPTDAPVMTSPLVGSART